jgi:hypothetical protein
MRSSRESTDRDKKRATLNSRLRGNERKGADANRLLGALTSAHAAPAIHGLRMIATGLGDAA